MASSITPDAPPRSGEAEGPRLLRRLVAPLLRAGWSGVEFETWRDGDPEEDRDGEADDDDWHRGAVSNVELERSGFHVTVSWDPTEQHLELFAPTEGLGWDESLPPLCPIDSSLTIDLAGHTSHAAQAEFARCAFAGAGLLDATRIRLPAEASSLGHDLLVLILADQLYGVAEQHRGRRDAGKVFESLGEEFSWRISAGLRAHPLIVPGPVPTAATLGVAEWCWRRESEVEDWHHKVDDLTMARANIAATRTVLPHVHLEGVDWPAVRVALTHPNRRLADGRALSDLFEEGWPPILASVEAQVDMWQRAEAELGPQAVLRLLTLHGSRSESVGDWWGSGWYETLTRRVIDNAAQDDSLPPVVPQIFPDPVQFADAAAHSPDLLDDDTLRWLTRAIFDEQSARHSAGEPNPTAITLPSWVVEQLTELLDTIEDDTPD